MKAFFVFILPLVISVHIINAQRKMYQLDSIIHTERYSSMNKTAKTAYTYWDNDSIKDIIDYHLDTLKKQFIPTQSRRFYYQNPNLYYYSDYYWDAVGNKFQFRDSFKVAKIITETITYDSSFVYKNFSWKPYTITTSWHNAEHYSRYKLYDSVLGKFIDSNTYFYFIQKKFDEYGRDTFSWQKRKINSDIIYKKVYDDSSRLSELYYAQKLNQYYLKEKLNYDAKGNLDRVFYNYIPVTNTSQKRSYSYFKYHTDITLKDCNFRYSNEYYGQPFYNVPIDETLPWDTIGAHFEKRQFFYSNMKAYSQVINLEKSTPMIYPNPSKGSLYHTGSGPLHLYFYTLEGRKIEQAILEPNKEYRLKNTASKLYFIEAFDSRGIKQFSERLVLE